MKKNLYIMYAISFLQGLVFYGPIATIYRQSRGLSIYQIFLLSSILMILMITLEIPWGFLADRFGYKRTLLLSYFIFFVSKIVFLNAGSFITFLVETILMAVAVSGISGCDSALLYSSAGEKESEKAFSYFSASSAAGFFTASFISTFIVENHMDYTVLFTVFAYMLAFIAALFLKDVNYKKQDISILSSIKNIFRNKGILLFVIAMSLVSESTHSICVFLNQPQYLKSGISISYFGLLSAIMQIICILSARSYSLSRKFGQKKLILWLFISITICSLLLAFVRSAYVSVIVIAAIEGTFALCQPLSQDIQNKSISTGDRATMLSAYAMAGDIFAAVTNISVGKASDLSLEFGFLLCGLFSAIAVILVIFYYKRSNFIDNDTTINL